MGDRWELATYRSFVGLIMFTCGEYRCVRHKHTAPVPVSVRVLRVILTVHRSLPVCP